MATSRTGTARWIKIRDKRRALSIEQGIFNCPLCNIGLDYEYSGHPNSAEVDHIIEHSRGGKDTLENTRILCRRCNASRGGKEGRKKQLEQQAAQRIRPLKTSRRW